MNNECRMHQKAYKIFVSNLKGYEGINGNVKVSPKREVRAEVNAYFVTAFISGSTYVSY
jgi:hypothetical protein